MSQPDFRTTRLHDWLGRIKAGDRGARNELITAAQARLDQLAGRMLRDFPKVRRWAETGDVAQVASLRLLRALETVEVADTREFLNLAAALVRRELLDLAKKYTGPHGLDANHASTPPDSDGRGAVEAKAVAPADTDLEKWAALHAAVETLPLELREVFGLVFYYGWANEDLAELLGVHVRTVRRRRLDAMQALRAAVGGEFPEALDGAREGGE